MKKILIVNNNMNIGGIQKSLLNLINGVCDDYEITLFLFYPSGPLLDEVKSKVKIASAGKLVRIMGMTQADAKKSGIFTFLWRSLWVLITRIFTRSVTYSILPGFEKLREEYDVAISFMQNADIRFFYGGCNEFVLKSVSAKKKFAFIHNDFLNFPGNLPYNNRLYGRFDKVACVSDSVKEAFCTVCPEYREKSFRVYNMHDFGHIKSEAEKFTPPLGKDCINIFTAARVSEEKGLLRMVPIFEALKKEKANFKWYVAGDGPLFGDLKQLVSKRGLESDIVLLGLQRNPYPYFKYADMVLLPSYNEAAPMIFGEAGFFGTPVLTTETTSAHELVGERGGWVVENDDNAIKKKLSELLFADRSIFNKKDGYDTSNSTAKADFENLVNN